MITYTDLQSLPKHHEIVKYYFSDKEIRNDEFCEWLEWINDEGDVFLKVDCQDGALFYVRLHDVPLEGNHFYSKPLYNLPEHP